MFAHQLLAKLGLTVSMSQGRRAVAMGAVKINDKPVSLEDDIEIKAGDVVKVGARISVVVTAEHLK